MGFAAGVLFMLWRPRLTEASRAHSRLVILFGLTMAVFNAFFYYSLVSLPLGIAVTLEFVALGGGAIEFSTATGLAVGTSGQRWDYLADAFGGVSVGSNGSGVRAIGWRVLGRLYSSGRSHRTPIQ